MTLPLQISFEMLRWHPQLWATDAAGNTVATMHRIGSGGIFGNFGIFTGASAGNTPSFALNFRDLGNGQLSYVITDAAGNDVIVFPFQIAVVAQRVPFVIQLNGERLAIHHETVARDTGASVLETFAGSWFDKELFDTFKPPLYSIRREGEGPMIQVTNNRRYWRNRYYFEAVHPLDPDTQRFVLPLAFTTSLLLKMLLIRTV
jgi:hypothetical protein